MLSWIGVKSNPSLGIVGCEKHLYDDAARLLILNLTLVLDQESVVDSVVDSRRVQRVRYLVFFSLRRNMALRLFVFSAKLAKPLETKKNTLIQSLEK